MVFIFLQDAVTGRTRGATEKYEVRVTPVLGRGLNSRPQVSHSRLHSHLRALGPRHVQSPGEQFPSTQAGQHICREQYGGGRGKGASWMLTGPCPDLPEQPPLCQQLEVAGASTKQLHHPPRDARSTKPPRGPGLDSPWTWSIDGSISREGRTGRNPLRGLLSGSNNGALLPFSVHP